MSSVARLGCGTNQVYQFIGAARNRFVLVGASISRCFGSLLSRIIALFRAIFCCQTSSPGHLTTSTTAVPDRDFPGVVSNQPTSLSVPEKETFKEGEGKEMVFQDPILRSPSNPAAKTRWRHLAKKVREIGFGQVRKGIIGLDFINFARRYGNPVEVDLQKSQEGNPYIPSYEMYLDGSQRACTLSEGVLDGSCDFVLGLDDQFYASQTKYSFYHSDFFDGKPIRAAGTIVFEDGKIVRISLSSGHYLKRLSEDIRAQKYNFLKVLQVLLKRQINITDVTFTTWHEGYQTQPACDWEAYFKKHQFEDSGHHGGLSQGNAENLLKDQRPGTWLLRSEVSPTGETQHYVSILIRSYVPEVYQSKYQHCLLKDELLEDLTRKYGFKFSDGSDCQLRPL